MQNLNVWQIIIDSIKWFIFFVSLIINMLSQAIVEGFNDPFLKIIWIADIIAIGIGILFILLEKFVIWRRIK